MKLKVLPPSVNRSLSTFNGADQEILFGLSGVKGVGSSAVDSIIETREEGGPFSSLKNFCDRVNLHKVNKRLVENLIQVGAFDFTGEPRRRQCAALDAFIMRAQKKQRDEAAGQDNLFDLLSKSADESVATFDEDPLENWRDIGEWNQKQLLDFEKLSLGFYVSGHPLDRFSDLIKSLSFTPICEIPQCDRFQAVILIGQVASMRAIPSRNGGRVAFITFEDHTGSVEVVASGATLDLYEPVLSSGEPMMLMGEVKRPRNEGDTFKVDIGRRGEDPKVTPFVQTLHDLQGMQTRAIEVSFSGEEVSTSPLRKFKSLVRQSQYQGRCPLILNVLTQEGAQVYIHTPITLHPDEELAHEIRQCIQGAQVKFLGRRAAQRLLKG
jgi:DNA polymerase III subunit alpha